MKRFVLILWALELAVLFAVSAFADAALPPEYEYQNQTRSYVGFRCVRSLANTTSDKIKLKKGKKK